MSSELSDVWPQLSERTQWIVREVWRPKLELDMTDDDLAQRHGVSRKQIGEWLTEVEVELRGRMGNVVPDLTPDEYDALKADIAERGVLHPIDVDERGRVLDGANRKRICKDLRIQCPVRVWEGLSEEQKFAFTLVSNLVRRQLNQSQRRQVVGSLLIREPERSDRVVAQLVGVSPTTVGVVRKELEQRGAVSRLDTRTDAIGRPQQATKARRDQSDRLLTIFVYASKEDRDSLVAGATVDGAHVSAWLLALGLKRRREQEKGMA